MCTQSSHNYTELDFTYLIRYTEIKKARQPTETFEFSQSKYLEGDQRSDIHEETLTHRFYGNRCQADFGRIPPRSITRYRYRSSSGDGGLGGVYRIVILTPI